MKNMLKRFASLAFALVLTLGLAPVMSPSANAEEERTVYNTYTGDYVENGTYYLRSYNGNYALGWTNGTYKITNRWQVKPGKAINYTYVYYSRIYLNGSEPCAITFDDSSLTKHIGYRIQPGGRGFGLNLTAKDYVCGSYNAGLGVLMLDNVINYGCARWSFEKVSGYSNVYRIKTQDDVVNKGKAYLSYSGQNVMLKEWSNGDTNQYWKLEMVAPKAGKTYYIQSATAGQHDNSHLDVYGASSDPGANVCGHTYNGGANQRWTLENAGNGYVYLKSGMGTYLDVAGSNKTSGTNVQTWTGLRNAAQKWKLVNAGNGSYYLKSALGNYLDLYYGRTANGTNVISHFGNSATAQKWRFIVA